jgi:hypothetical protein
LATIRLATGRQINRVFFPPTDAGSRMARRHLKRLVDLRVLTRLNRSIGGRGGSQSFRYALDVNGQRIASRRFTRTVRRPTPSQQFIEHTLGVTEILVLLKEAERAGAVDSPHFEAEPASWRATNGGRRSWLKPDAFARWNVGDWELLTFFEVDRATEHPGRIGRKADEYLRYWRSGLEQASDGVFPAVLWIVPDERREAVLATALASRNAEAPLFQITTTADLAGWLTNQTKGGTP